MVHESLLMLGSYHMSSNWVRLGCSTNVFETSPGLSTQDRVILLIYYE